MANNDPQTIVCQMKTEADFERNGTTLNLGDKLSDTEKVYETILESSDHMNETSALTEEVQLHENSSNSEENHIDIKDNIIQQNNVPNSKANYDEISQTTVAEIVTPFHLHMFYSLISNTLRQVIDCFISKYIKKHKKQIDKLNFFISEVSNEETHILQKRLDIMIQQQKVFEDCMENIKQSKTKTICTFKSENVSCYYKEALNDSQLECKLFKKASFIYAYKDEILSSVSVNQVTIISADVCYSTSEVIPHFLHQAYPNDTVLSCEPTADTAISLAMKCQDFGGNNLIGYDIEGGLIGTNDIKIIFMSASDLHNKNIIDHCLSNCEIIIVHCDLKRSLETDILLEQLRNHLNERSDFKAILLLSSLDNISKFANYFSLLTVNTLTLPDITFPVQTVWLERSFSTKNLHMKCVMDTALAIHVLNDAGDVLIFLPSSYDVNEIQTSLPLKFFEYNYHNILCISLSENKYRPSSIDFGAADNKDTSKRKFYLTTHSAESLSLPSITYVIDTGIDGSTSIYNKEFLNQCLISQERAVLREHYAGQYGKGICYRLYSEQDYLEKMSCYELPEMLYETSHNIMTRLLNYYFTSIMTVDFVENLHEEEKEKVLIMLKEVDAIKECELTTLGTQIIKFPFLPRYSKLIALGIKHGFLFEAVVLVAFFLVNKPIFFYCTNNKESQKIAETTKRKYSLCDSDTLTYLKIFREFSLIDTQHLWCKERMLDFNILDSVQAHVAIITNIIEFELGTCIDREIKIEHESNCFALQELLFDCFKSNLCVYTGHEHHGYNFFATKHLTFLDPSSVLSKNNLPEFVVFDSFKQSSEHVMISVTSIPRKIVLSAIQNNLLVIETLNIPKRGLKPITVENIGVMRMKQVLLDENGEKLPEIKNRIIKETTCDILIIEPLEEKGKVNLFAPAEFAEIAENMVHDLLESSLNYEDLLTAKLKKEGFEVSVRVLWNKGAVATQITSLHSDISKIGNYQINYRNCESDYESKGYEIEGYQMNHEPEKYQINHEPEKCQMNYEIEKDHVEAKNNKAMEYKSVILTWLRKRVKIDGFVSFKNNYCACTPQLNKTSITNNGEQNENMNELYISGIPSCTTTNELKLAVEAAFKVKFSCDANIENVTLVEVMDKELSVIQEQVFNDCCNILCTNKFTLAIQKPKHNAQFMQAVMTFNTSNHAIINQNVNMLNTYLKIYGVSVNAVASYSSTIICKTSICKTLQQKVDAELDLFNNMQRLKQSHGSIVVVDEQEPDFTKLQLLANTECIMIDLQRIVYRLLEGELVTSDNLKKFHRLFTHGGHLWLRALEQQIDVYIIDNYKLKVLRVYGTQENCETAFQRIETYLLNTDNEIVKKIDLADGRYAGLLLQSIIKTYGLDMKDFILKFKLKSAVISIRDACLVLHGDPESIERSLDELENTILCDVNKSILACLEVCSVCHTIPIQHTLRLECCSHLYCIECLKNLIVNSKLPIQCCTKDCEKELFLNDIYIGLDHDETEINNLLCRSIKDFISKNSEQFIHCPAPDCSMFFDKTASDCLREVASDSRCCPLCHNDICIKCNEVYHHGYTCEMYQGTKTDPDYAVKAWMNDNKPGRKQCPKCSTRIEKNEGCNHMKCSSCGIDFCWLCLRTFPDGQLTYDHEVNCSGYR